MKTKRKLSILLTIVVVLLSFIWTYPAKAVERTTTSLPERVLVGYWHNWKSSGKDGYKGGTSGFVDLKDVNSAYNVIDVSFMKCVGNNPIPTFKPDFYSDQEMKQQVSSQHQKGHTVLLALGGADAHIALHEQDKKAFVQEIKRQMDTYGFDGIDIDLEQSAITEEDNAHVIPEALKEVKDDYKKQGRPFFITMAPEFPYLKPGAAYEKYIQSLQGYYDYIAPQFYNQGGDGVWVDSINKWIAQNNDELKEEFLYYMADSLIHGTRGYLQIPNNKLVIGLPANIDAAGSGFVKKPEDVYQAFEQLKLDGNPIRGLMTWSINWDVGKNAQGASYNQQFVRDYQSLIYPKASLVQHIF